MTVLWYGNNIVFLLFVAVFTQSVNNVRMFFTIQKAVEKKKYTAGQIEKIMGGNWVRVLTDCLG